MTYRQFVDYVLQRQRLYKPGAPDGDWPPSVYFDHGPHVATHPIPKPLLANAATKRHFINNVVCAYIATARPVKVATVVGVYQLTEGHPVGQIIAERILENPDESPTRGLPRFQEIEGSTEWLMVQVFDAERFEPWQARVLRSKSAPPRLGPFELPGVDALTGAWSDPIREAMR